MDSSSEEDSAVNELLSQAKDQIILEQLAAINCSSFTDDDSILPSHLESRFSKLKSFPASKPISSSAASFNPNDQIAPNSRSGSHPKPPESSPAKPETRLEAKQTHGSGSLSPNSSNSSPDSATFSPAKRVSKKKKKKKKKLMKSRSAKPGWLSSLSSPLGSCNSTREEESPSPPRKAGCFWCSPKSDRSDKTKGNVGGIGLDLSDDDDELFSGLGSFSKREQRKIVKKAMKEEEKISREAEKIVKWAKQQSARMNVNLTDDELSD